MVQVDTRIGTAWLDSHFVSYVVHSLIPSDILPKKLRFLHCSFIGTGTYSSVFVQNISCKFICLGEVGL